MIETLVHKVDLSVRDGLCSKVKMEMSFPEGCTQEELLREFPMMSRILGGPCPGSKSSSAVVSRGK